MENKAQPMNLSELKKLVEDCFVVKPWIYWLDFGGSTLLAWGSFLVTELNPHPLVQGLAFLVTVFALYRAVLFIHEISHLNRSDIPFFSIIYNLTIGIATVPSFMYRGVHIDHHKKNYYGTAEDGEYLPFGAQSPRNIILYYLQCFTILPTLLIRFGILSPLSLLHPKFRKLLMERGSALAIQFHAKRKIPTGIDLRNWYILEFLCFVFTVGTFALFVTHVLPWKMLLHFYFVLATVMFLNSTRTLVAHRYTNRELGELNFQDQLLDSVNLDGNAILHELMAPVGLRYHALHHLFPSMPYHSLNTAHQRLKSQLPPDSFYHACNEPNIVAAFNKLWKSAENSAKSK